MKFIIEYLAIDILVRGIIRQIISFSLKKNSFQLQRLIIVTILLSLFFLISILLFLNYQHESINVISFSIAIIIVHGLNYIFSGNKHYLELCKDNEFENGSYLKYYLCEFYKYISKISLSIILVNELINQLKILRN